METHGMADKVCSLSIYMGDMSLFSNKLKTKKEGSRIVFLGI